MSTYNRKQIAWELERTALGDGFYGNALRVAKDIPGVTDADRSLLDSYATGTQGGTAHVALQELAMRIYRSAQHTPGPWKPAKYLTPPARGPFNPALPWVLYRKVGRYSETMRDAAGEIVYFATEGDAIAKATGSAS